MTTPASISLTIAVGQLNPLVSDLDGNTEKARKAHQRLVLEPLADFAV